MNDKINDERFIIGDKPFSPIYLNPKINYIEALARELFINGNYSARSAFSVAEEFYNELEERRNKRSEQ